MTDPASPTLLERLSALILREPSDRAGLVQLLRSAYQRNLLDADAVSIVEGALTAVESGCTLNRGGRAHRVRDAGARHHEPGGEDGRHRHQRAGRPVHAAGDQF